jgi:hypothetical protein
VRGTQLARRDGLTSPSVRREDVLDHAVIGTPNGPEYWELVEILRGRGLTGWAIKRYGGLVPWSLFERRLFRDRRTAEVSWMEATGGREASR